MTDVLTPHQRPTSHHSVHPLPTLTSKVHISLLFPPICSPCHFQAKRPKSNSISTHNPKRMKTTENPPSKVATTENSASTSKSVSRRHPGPHMSHTSRQPIPAKRPGPKFGETSRSSSRQPVPAKRPGRKLGENPFSFNPVPSKMGLNTNNSRNSKRF